MVNTRSRDPKRKGSSSEDETFNLAENPATSDSDFETATTSKKKSTTSKNKAAPAKPPAKKRKIKDIPPRGAEDVRSGDIQPQVEEGLPLGWQLEPLPARQSVSRGMNLFRKAIKGGEKASDIFPFSCSDRTLRATQVQYGGVKFKNDAKNEYTPVVGRLQHLRDHPKIRDFTLAVDEIALYDVTMGGTVKKKQMKVNGQGVYVNAVVTGGQPTKVWCIKAYRVTSTADGHAKKETIEYFVSHPSQARIKCNAITQQVCPTRADAIRLGQVVVDFTNRFPAMFESSLWNSKSKSNWYEASVFVEVTALHEFDKTMDLPKVLGEGFLRKSIDVYFQARATSAVRGPNVRAIGTGRLSRRAVAQVVANGELVPLSSAPWDATTPPSKELDLTAVATIPDLPKSYEPFLREEDSAVDNVSVRLHRYCQSTLFGTIGPLELLKQAWIDVQLKFLKKSRPTLPSLGPFNGFSLFQKPLKQESGGAIIQLTSAAIGSALEVPVRPRRLGKTSGLYFITASQSLILHSHICQAVVNSIYRGEGLLNAIRFGHLASADVDSGRVGTADALASLDSQEALDPQAPVVCNHCMQVTVVAEALRDDIGRRLCSPCARKATHTILSDISSHLTVQARILMLVTSTLRKDIDKASPNPIHKVDAQSVLRTLEKQAIDESRWRSACSSGERSIGDAVWTFGPLRSEYSGYRFSHPEQMSMGKPFPIFIDENGTSFHGPKNTFLQTLLENLLQGDHAIGLLPCLAEVATAAISMKQDPSPPSFGYPEALRPLYEKFDRMADNSYMIFGGLPASISERSTQTIWTTKNMKNLLAMLKSCEWDGKVVRSSQKCITTRAGIRNFTRTTRLDGRPRKTPVFPHGADLKRVLNNLKKIVRPGGRFNPNRLIVNSNSDGSYWIGRDGEKPEDADFAFEFYEAVARWWTWDEDCDEENETEESPETIMYETLRQHISNEGKCPTLKFRLSVIAGHAEVYSLGRATHRLDQHGNPTDEIIKAGDALRTGCTSLHPVDIEKEYDFRRCTVVRESLLVNRSRSNHPYNDLAPLLTAISKISVDPLYCDPVRPAKGDYRPVILPRRWNIGGLNLVAAADARELLMTASERVATEVLDEYDDFTKQEGFLEVDDEEKEDLGEKPKSAEGKETSPTASEKQASDEDQTKAFNVLVYDINTLSLERDETMTAHFYNLMVPNMVDPDSIAANWIISVKSADGGATLHAVPTDDHVFILHEHEGLVVANWEDNGTVTAVESDWQAEMIITAGNAGQDLQTVDDTQPTLPELYDWFRGTNKESFMASSQTDEVAAKMVQFLNAFEVVAQSSQDIPGNFSADHFAGDVAEFFDMVWPTFSGNLDSKPFHRGELLYWRTSSDRLSGFMSTWDNTPIRSEENGGDDSMEGVEQTTDIDKKAGAQQVESSSVKADDEEMQDVEQATPSVFETVQDLIEWWETWDSRDEAEFKSFVRYSPLEEVYAKAHAILVAIRAENTHILAPTLVIDAAKLFNQIWAKGGSVIRFTPNDVMGWMRPDSKKDLKIFSGWMDRKQQARSRLDAKTATGAEKGSRLQQMLGEIKAKQAQADQLLEQVAQLKKDVLAAQKEQNDSRKQRQADEALVKEDFFRKF
ncbi:unnamed protein product [Zymoseptoria tritici ST99CH_1A5]|uniref:Uncharacterized protein n=1 Tax=Zymoseptoria tritici ST99CH_1A5 TaxID=1276529 RepID=A0A1Y6LF35_ZYMTR|nr:unnamed protein product [Zymoseptoria tritici ST99CH_1A5]